MPPTPEVSSAVLVSGVQGDVFQTNDTDQEEVGGRMRGNRFAAISEAGDERHHFGHRGRTQPDGGWSWSHNMGWPTHPTMSGIQTRRASRGMSDVEIHDVVEPTVVPEPIDMDRVRAPGGAFSSKDAVSLITVFERRAM